MLPSRRQVWAERFSRYHASSRTVKDFCQAEGVSVPSFYKWKKILAQGEAATPDAFVPINLLGHPGGDLDLVLPGGATLKLSGQLDDTSMRKVLAAVVAVTVEADAS